VVYHGIEEISPGVICEMVHAKSYGIPVYALYPKEPSPFFEYYSNRIFRDGNSFLKFLKEVAKG
jgi:adenylate kinase